MNVLIRCDGFPEIGLGHVVRCLALADELHEVHNCRITFAMRKGPLGIQMVEEKDYQVLTSEENDQSFDYKEWLNECVRNVEAKAIILDVRDGLARTVLDELRNEGILIVTIDDPEDKRLSADLAYYPPVPQVKRIDWTGFTGKLYVGWEWVILRKEFAEIKNKGAVNSKSSIPKVLFTMGGSDPQAMTLKVIKSLDALDDDFDTVVVIGAGFRHRNELNKLLSAAQRRFEVKENVTDMAGLMAQANLAVASFGVTAYELASLRVPAIYLCLTQDHVQSAEVFVEAGVAVNMGLYEHVTEQELARTVARHLRDEVDCLNVATLVDGRGAERVATIILKKLEQVYNDN